MQKILVFSCWLPSIPVGVCPLCPIRPLPLPLTVSMSTYPHIFITEQCEEEVIGLLIRNRGQVSIVLVQAAGGPGLCPGQCRLEQFVTSASVRKQGPARGTACIIFCRY